MAQRRDRKMDSIDFFPTPAWATRALMMHVVYPDLHVERTCLEPACGEGHMAEPLKEYFSEVTASDVNDFGYGAVSDFLLLKQHPNASFDWVITNPPFVLGQEFILRALPIARRGVAMLLRTQFVEGLDRLTTLFGPHPPAFVAQFAERVPMFEGKVKEKGSTATAYAWFVWSKAPVEFTQLMWIPPCRKALERPDDYE